MADANGKLRILITGATGFLGRPLVRELSSRYAVTAVVRTPQQPSRNIDFLECEDLIDLAKPGRLEKFDVLIHCAARAHILNDTATDPLDEFRAVNVKITEALVKAAVKAQVGRFVFISSIKVNGENTLIDRPYRAVDAPAPLDPYGISKLEAELTVTNAVANSKTDFVIIRPPLIYGPNAKGNLRALNRLARLPIPVPLGKIDNKRSLISVANLISLIESVMIHPAAAGQTFLASDGQDLSTSELFALMRKANGLPPLLIPMPLWLAKFLMVTIGRRGLYDRLFGSLQIEATATQSTLGWLPRQTPEEAINAAFSPISDQD